MTNEEALPRFVHVRHVQGRSIPFSQQGKMTRLRKGDLGILPRELYERYAWRLEVIDPDNYSRLQAAMVKGDMLRREQEPPEGLAEPGKTEGVIEWELKVPPEEYYELYRDRPNPSAKLKQRLAIAKQLIGA